MMWMWERYQNDPILRAVVDQMHALIEQGQLTPTEIREAAMLAQIMFEDRHPRPMVFSAEDVRNGRV